MRQVIHGVLPASIRGILKDAGLSERQKRKLPMLNENATVAARAGSQAS
jgi:hypothetical protein